MEAMTPRQNKVARLVQKELASMMQTYARNWFHGTLISVSIVRVSPDLSFAKCYFSIFPVEKSKEVMENLEQHQKEIRFQLGNRIHNQVRIIPELAFFVDDSQEYLEKIETLLKK
jgi:ribosome-binding factor A